MIWVYVFLGIVQGIFEWLPISSEGVVALLSQFLIEGVRPIDLALFLHLGTFLAVLVYFRKDWWEILTFKKPKLLKFLLLATIVSLIIGYPLYQLVKDVAVGNILLFLTGFGLLGTAFFHRKKRKVNWRESHLALFTGFLQGLSVIPGLSRSGSTIFGLSLGKDKPAEILKLSYLLSGPIVLASSLYFFLEKPVLILEAWPALVFSFLVGILSLSFLLKLAQKVDFYKFAIFFALLCFLGGILTMI